MSEQLFQKLEDKIMEALELIEFLRTQLQDEEEKNNDLRNEIDTLRNRQAQWENSLATMLRKLDSADLSIDEQSREEMELEQPR